MASYERLQHWQHIFTKMRKTLSAQWVFSLFCHLKSVWTCEVDWTGEITEGKTTYILIIWSVQCISVVEEIFRSYNCVKAIPHYKNTPVRVKVLNSIQKYAQVKEKYWQQDALWSKSKGLVKQRDPLRPLYYMYYIYWTISAVALMFKQHINVVAGWTTFYIGGWFNL